MPKPVKTRTYDSPLRTEQARATKASIVAAARDAFVAQGYVATSIQAIARRAGTSPETIYATFKTKRALLAAVVDVSIAGDDAPVPVLERPWVRQMRDEPNPRSRIAMLARNGRQMLQRWTPIYDVLHAAAAADEEIAELWERNKQQRYQGQRELVGIIVAGTPADTAAARRAAADAVFAIGSPETYRLLVTDRGWSAERWERWYAQMLERMLFD